MLRSVLSIVVGLVVAIIIMMALQWAGHRLFPIPPHIDLNDQTQLARYLAQAPVGALVMVLLSYGLGACDGAILAAWFSPQRPWRHAAVVVVVLSLLAILNALGLTHPDWFVWSLGPTFVVALLVGGKIGCMLHDRRRAGIMH